MAPRYLHFEIIHAITIVHIYETEH